MARLSGAALEAELALIRLPTAPIALIALCLVPETTAAEFTFRRVGIPEPDAPKRITVQINLRDNEAARATQDGSSADPVGGDALMNEPRDATQSNRFTEFWLRLPDEKGPRRLALAANLLHVPPVEAPLRRLAGRYGAMIVQATQNTIVSPALVLAVMMVESSGRTDAISNAGAAGLMQLMPATAQRFGVTDRLDPRQSVRGAVRYLDWLLREFDGDAILALAGYNAGENAVKRHRGVPPYQETLAYVPKVVAAWRVANSLCGSGEPPACNLTRVASGR